MYMLLITICCLCYVIFLYDLLFVSIRKLQVINIKLIISIDNNVEYIIKWLKGLLGMSSKRIRREVETLNGLNTSDLKGNHIAHMCMTTDWTETS